MKQISVLRKILRKINKKRRMESIKFAHEKNMINHKLDYEVIDRIIEKYRESGGLKHDFQSYKLWCLKELLQEYKPHSILEFGSGSSTLILADYVRKNNGILLSIDENKRWAENTKDLIAISLDDDIEILVKEKIVIYRSPVEIKYDLKIKESYDLVLIDGPSLTVEGIKYKNAVNTNVFELPTLPKIILVDMRETTTKYLCKKYSGKYKVHLSDLISGNPVKENYNYFSVFNKII